MGLFDAIREKANELLSGATDQVSEVTGNIPGEQAVDGLTETATGTVNDTVADTTGSLTDATDTVTGTVTDTTEAIGEHTDPYRP